MEVMSSPASLSSSPGEGSESLQLLACREGSPSFSLLSGKLAVTYQQLGFSVSCYSWAGRALQVPTCSTGTFSGVSFSLTVPL